MAGADTTARSWLIFRLLAAFLTLQFLWNLLVPGGAWPLSPVHYMNMAFDLGMLIGLIGVRSRLAAAYADNSGRLNMMYLLFVVGVIAGVGLLGIRFTSDAAWYTGHLRN